MSGIIDEVLMKEFIVNKYLTLKLIKDKTFIYVNNDKFLHCKFLLLTIPINEIKSFDEIESIDEAIEELDKGLEPVSNKAITIPPEIEFWGHCSNLQVWSEYNYDTRFLHSNLAFPLLKKLTEVGDPVAKLRFKEEIIKRYACGNKNVRNFLYERDYLSFLDDNEFLENILRPEEAKSMIELISKSNVRYKYVRNFDDDEVRDRYFLEPLFYSIKDGYIDELELDLKQFDFSLPDLLLSFSKLRSLKLFIISNRFLEKILKFDIKLTTIKSLDMLVRGMVLIPNSFQNFPSLISLIIQGDETARFNENPNSIGHLKNLVWLDINSIHLDYIPESFKKLKALDWLSLIDVKLKERPKKTDFENLRDLIIEDIEDLDTLEDLD